MSKFCVKAAIVFSLAIAEPVLDATVGPQIAMNEEEKDSSFDSEVQITTVVPKFLTNDESDENPSTIDKILEKASGGADKLIDRAEEELKQVKEKIDTMNDTVSKLASGTDLNLLKETVAPFLDPINKLLPLISGVGMLVPEAKDILTKFTSNFNLINDKVGKLENGVTENKDDLVKFFKYQTGLVAEEIDNMLDKVNEAKTKKDAIVGGISKVKNFLSNLGSGGGILSNLGSKLFSAFRFR